MKRILIIFFVLSIVAFFVIKFFGAKDSYEGVFPENQFSQDNVILVDSLDVNYGVVYWVCFDLGINNYTNSKLYFNKGDFHGIHFEKEKPILISSYITSLEYVNNTLIVHTFKNQYGYESDTRKLVEKLDFEIKIEEDGDTKLSLENRLRSLK